MRKDDLKACLDAVKPDAYMKTRIEANAEAESAAPAPRRKKQWARVLLAAMLCFALTAGIIGFDLYGSRNAVPPETESAVSTPFGIIDSGRVPGGLIYAYAEDGVENDALINDLTMALPTQCRICFIRTDGMSEEEYAAASQALADKMEYTSPPADGVALADGAHGAYIGHYDNDSVELRDFMAGSFYLDLTEEEQNELASLHFYCENDCMQFCYDSPADTYGDALPLDGTYVTSRFAYLASDVKMSGDNYRKNVLYNELTARFENAFTPVCFYYEIKTTEPSFVTMVAENPDFVISDLKDTLHFEVYFDDGSFTETVVAITFDADGYMSITPLTCHYTPAEEETEETTEESAEEMTEDTMEETTALQEGTTLENPEETTASEETTDEAPVTDQNAEEETAAPPHEDETSAQNTP